MSILINAKDAIVSRFGANGLYYGMHITGNIDITLDYNARDIIVTMADNGGEVPERILKEIFTPYVSSKGDKDTGIGLYIAKVVMDNMKGTISVKNSTQGAVFTLILPRSEY